VRGGDDDNSFTGSHGVVTAGNLQAWRDVVVMMMMMIVTLVVTAS